MNSRPEFDDSNYRYTPFLGKQIYTNCNFSIFLTPTCNANCKFCVAHIRNRKLESHEITLDCIRKAIEIVKPLNPTVSLSGGEPTLSPLFEQAADMVKDFRKKAVTTNGHNLGKIIPILKRNGWNFLNISIPHYDEGKIKEMMRWDKTIDPSDVDFPNVRLSCLLSKEGISTKEQVLEYVEFYRKKNVRNFIFRQMTQWKSLSESSENKEIIKYTEDNKVDMRECIPEEFELFKTNRGYYYWVLLHKHKDCVIAYEAADLNERPEGQEKIYELVLHPNGNLCYGWDPEGEILCQLR